MFAEDVIVEFPFAPGEAFGFPKKIKGKPAIIKYAQSLKLSLRDYKINLLSEWGRYSLSDSKMYLFEYKGDAFTVPGNKPYEQDMNAFVEVANGK